jgi:pilus assembly protein Flp/PilA
LKSSAWSLRYDDTAFGLDLAKKSERLPFVAPLALYSREIGRVLRIAHTRVTNRYQYLPVWWNFPVLLEGKDVMLNHVGRLLRDDAGATAIEYGLIAALIAVAIIAAATAVGGNLATLFTSIGGSL